MTMSSMNPRQLQRFFVKFVIQDDGCWIWRSSPHPRSYGYFYVDSERRSQLAHRVSYEHFRGPIPDGLQIDHLCRMGGCVNPDHMEVVTNRENTLRGTAGQHYSLRTHCKAGHPFDAENTILRSDAGRRCRACRTEYDRKKWQERKPHYRKRRR